MGTPDKFHSTRRVALAVKRCSPLQTSILADIAESLAGAGPMCITDAAPVIVCLRETFCLNCGVPIGGCVCQLEE